MKAFTKVAKALSDRGRIRQFCLSYGVLIIITLFFFFPVLFQDKTFYAFGNLYRYYPWVSHIEDLPNTNYLLTDPIHAQYPSNLYIPHLLYEKSINNGGLPLWNPFNFSGLPYIPYSYPVLYFLFTLFDVTTAHDLLLFFHIFATGVFTYLYLKKIDIQILPAMIGAVSWMLNGYILVWLEFEIVPMFASTLVASLFFIELWWEKKNLLSFFGMVLAIAVSICLSHAHYIIYQLSFLGIYVIYRIFSEWYIIKSDFKRLAFLLSGPAVAVIISLIISANFITSHLMLYKMGQRKSYQYDELFEKTGQLPGKYLTTLLFPDLFGNPATGICFTPKASLQQNYNNYNELCIYTGIVTLILSMVCIPYIGRRKYVAFFIVVGACSIMISMGSIIYYPMARLIPGLSMSTPTRILYLFGFSISVLAALGAELILNDKIKRRFPILFIWIFLFFVAITIVLSVQTETGVKWMVSSKFQENWSDFFPLFQSHFSLLSKIIYKPLIILLCTLVLLICAIALPAKKHKKNLLYLALLLLIYDLFSFGWKYNTMSPDSMEYPSTPAIGFLQKDSSKFRIMTFGNFMNNTFTPFEIEDIGGYNSFYPKRYGDYLHLSQNGPNAPLPEESSRWIHFYNFGSPLLDIINTKYLLVPPGTKINIETLRRVYSGEIDIYENQNVFHRIFFAPQYVHARNSDEAYKMLSKFDRKDFRNKVIIESKPSEQFIEHSGMSDKGSEANIKILSYKSNIIEFEVNADSNGFVVIGDNYHPGWCATIDGEPVNIFRANYIMRAVPVLSGTHHIVLRFRPLMMLTGLTITIIGWVVVLSLMFAYLLKISFFPGFKLKPDQN